MSVADALMLAPWLLFVAGLVMIGYRLLHRRSAVERHRRHIR